MSNIKRKQPNILIVMTDQMRASSMGFVGQEDVITPYIDNFASESTWFKRGLSNNPACSPARASLMTGLYPLSHGLVTNDLQLGTDFKGLAHGLNDQGYKCGYIGKWHMDCSDRGVFIPPGPRRQGFDDFWAAYNCNHDYYSGYYYLNDNPEPIWIDGYEPQAQTKIAIDYIEEKVKGDEPFCLFLSFGPPHCPYLEVPDEYLKMYPEDSFRIRPNAEGVESLDKKTIAGYYAHITALDTCFGQVLDSLKRSGIDDKTIVLFTSDHGDMLFSQNRGWKSKPWLESVNIPFIMRWPGHIPSRNINNGLIGLVDVMPTLLSLVGGDIPEGIQGSDLSQLVLGDENASPETAFINFPVIPDFFSYEAWRGVVTKRYSYARFKNDPWLLFDDINDPYQQHNLINEPDYKPLLDEMENYLSDWLIKLEDPFESSIEVADKYAEVHVGGVPPYYENDVVKAGKKKIFNYDNHKKDD